MEPRCPICDRVTTDTPDRWRPFCSERCKLVDLDRWFSEDYRIPGPPVQDEPPNREGE